MLHRIPDSVILDIAHSLLHYPLCVVRFASSCKVARSAGKVLIDVRFLPGRSDDCAHQLHLTQTDLGAWHFLRNSHYGFIGIDLLWSRHIHDISDLPDELLPAPFLTKLSIHGPLRSIHPIHTLEALTDLSVCNLETLGSLTALQKSCGLTRLAVAHCHQVEWETLPNTLRYLNVTSCDNFTTTNALVRLQRLSSIEITSCPHFTHLTSESGCRSLGRIKVHLCHAITRMAGFRCFGGRLGFLDCDLGKCTTGPGFERLHTFTFICSRRSFSNDRHHPRAVMLPSHMPGNGNLRLLKILNFGTTALGVGVRNGIQNALHEEGELHLVRRYELDEFAGLVSNMSLKNHCMREDGLERHELFRINIYRP